MSGTQFGSEAARPGRVNYRILSARYKAGASAALLASLATSSFATGTTLISSVSLACDSCRTYTDLRDFAAANAYRVGVGITPPGFEAGAITQPGYTKIVVTARNAPMSFAFDYAAQRGSVGGFLSHVVYYTYSVTPLGDFPASDQGALAQDQQIFKALRASGLPTVELPRTNDAGTILDLVATPSFEAIESFVSRSLFFAPVAPQPRFRPYYLGVGLGVEIIYNNKKYLVFEGDTFQIKDANGATADVEFRLGTFASTVGYVRIKISTVKPAQATGTSAAPPPSGALNGLTLNALDPSTFLFNGIPIYLYNPTRRELTPSVEIILFPLSLNPSTYVINIG